MIIGIIFGVIGTAMIEVFAITVYTHLCKLKRKNSDVKEFIYIRREDKT